MSSPFRLVDFTNCEGEIFKLAQNPLYLTKYALKNGEFRPYVMVFGELSIYENRYFADRIFGKSINYLETLFRFVRFSAASPVWAISAAQNSFDKFVVYMSYLSFSGKEYYGLIKDLYVNRCWAAIDFMIESIDDYPYARCRLTNFLWDEISCGIDNESVRERLRYLISLIWENREKQYIFEYAETKISRVEKVRDKIFRMLEKFGDEDFADEIKHELKNEK